MARQNKVIMRCNILILVCILSVHYTLSETAPEEPKERVSEAELIIGSKFDGFQIIQNKILRLRSIICNSSVGRIPGKLTEKNKAYYSYNKREYVCHNYEVNEAQRIKNTGEIPQECEGKGYSTIDNKMIYPVIVINKHGEIPGKAYDGTYGYYGFDRGQYRRKKFYWFC